MPDGSGILIKKRLQEGEISRETKELKGILVLSQEEKKSEFRVLWAHFSSQSGCVCVCHRYLHPEGLPSEYTISMMLRLLPETPQEPFALWEILDKHNQPLVGLILDSTFDCLLLKKKKEFWIK